MFRQASKVALTVLVVAGSLATATAAEPKEAEGKTTGPPKELTVDLGKGIKLEMVLIPAGEFLMGLPGSEKSAIADEIPHRVRITRPFYLGKYLVTQEQWEALMGNNPSHFRGPKNPVESISWNDCQQFLETLNAKSRTSEGKFQLPTEAQWEYACRAGSKTKYCFGDDETILGDYGWYKKNSGDTTHPVGEKKSNAWGLYDMHGNVYEWCVDGFDSGYYQRSPTDDPTAPPGEYRVIRGGCWGNYSAKGCESAIRIGMSPAALDAGTGFRVSLVSADKSGARSRSAARSVGEGRAEAGLVRAE